MPESGMDFIRFTTENSLICCPSANEISLIVHQKAPLEVFDRPGAKTFRSHLFLISTNLKTEYHRHIIEKLVYESYL